MYVNESTTYLVPGDNDDSSMRLIAAADLRSMFRLRRSSYRGSPSADGSVLTKVTA